jgi:protein-S-isoprenylcysteine O-methyltransferase Ste14
MTEPTHKNWLQQNRSLLIKAFIRIILFYFILTGATLFFPYGSMAWPQVWIMLGLWYLYFLLLFLWGSRVNPGVILERAGSLEKRGQAPTWDQKIMNTYMGMTIVLNVLSGLDAGRFGWSKVPTAAVWIAFPFVLISYIMPFWAVLSNPFASGVVRIQTERDHYVVSNGPYGFIRHPMYVATVFYGIAVPVFLGSYWGLVPGVIIIALLFRRTYLEDQMLQAELPGYKKYAQKVRYRLIPGIW